MKGLFRRSRAAQELPEVPAVRFYGDGNTIHSTGHLDVETRDGKVVAVWFRCQMLPFKQAEVGASRASIYTPDDNDWLPALVGVTVTAPAQVND